MLVKSGDKTNPSKLFKRLLLLQEKAIRKINFQPQTSPSKKTTGFLRSQIILITKDALFFRNALRKKNFQIFNNMFTPLGINHTHKTRAATNHLLEIPWKQNTHCGTNSMTSTSSVTRNGLLRKTSQNFVDCKITEFKRTVFQTYLAKYSSNN